jgi:hypothetical protein
MFLVLIPSGSIRQKLGCGWVEESLSIAVTMPEFGSNSETYGSHKAK